MKQNWSKSKIALAAILSVVAGVTITSTNLRAQESWKGNAITPVSNPIFFEDPRITSEARPIFINHWLPNTFHFAGGTAPLGGEVRVYALQLRYALTDKLALIATKDGYIESVPDHTLPHAYGWANIAAGFKYALIDKPEKQLIVTPGLTIELPTGNQRVFQGNGKGDWNPFVSAEKGFDKFHIIGNLGFRLPNDWDEQTAQMHYSLQLDYAVCRYFIPFVNANGLTVLSEGDNKLLGVVPLNTELYDLSNFGSTDARGVTQITAGGGARSKITRNLDLGIAYEVGVTHPVGIFDSRITADLIWRFK